MPPAGEGRGVGTLLRQAAEARAVERGETLVRQYVPAGNELARTHLLAAGYWPAYSYFRMRMELADAAAAARRRPRAGVRPRDRRRARSTRSSRRRWPASPGNEPRSLESWQAAKVDKEGWDPSLWLLHEDADGLAGVVLCERWEERRRLRRLPRRRARGPAGTASAARCCCTASPRCATRGLAAAELSVQGENASATRLYESVGMRPVWTIERWEKSLRAV